MRRFFRGILKSNAGSKPPWRTPDHPPYSEMVEVALRALSEEGGSTESTISAYIESTFTDLPWGHDRLLSYYLGKLLVSGEISSPSHGRYQLSIPHHHLLPSGHSLVRRRGRSSLYRPNPSSYTSFKSPPSASPRRRGRSLVARSRGRLPEIFAECTPMRHLEQESAPLRPRRGRPPLQREGAVGGATRRSVPRARRSRGSRIRQDGVRGRKLLNNEDCADNPDCFELIHAQSSPEQLQSLLPPGPNFLSPDLPDQGEGRQFRNARAWHCSSETSAFSDGKKVTGSETRALDYPEQPMHDEGGGHPFVASPQPEHGEEHEFTASLLSQHDEGQFSVVREVPLLTLEPAKVSYCPSPEHSEHREWKSPQGEALSSTVLEQTEPIEEQASPGERPTVLSLEKPENDGHCPENPENDVRGPEMPENNVRGPERPENDGRCPEKPENSGHGPEKPENDCHSLEKPRHNPGKPENNEHSLEKPDDSPEKPENDGQGSEKLENDGHGPEWPENDIHGPEKPENDGHGPKKPENKGHGPEKPENDGHGAEKHENDGHGTEKHENDGHGTEKHENDGQGPEMLENDDHDPAMSENDDHGLEKPEEDHDKCLLGKRTAMVALEQELLLLPDRDEVGSSGASTKKRKSHGRRRRLKLWFEG